MGIISSIKMAVCDAMQVLSNGALIDATCACHTVQ
ncbi:hypothetical protein Tsp_11719 [Trichinella spiralis]|nr:hypothetical protein Tsp_11719 [Trichinella spiralis]